MARILTSESGSGRCFSAWRMALWAVDFSAALMPCKHPVEGGEVANLLVANPLGNFLDDAEHGALADRAVLALEHVVVGQALDRRLEHRDLVGDERIGVDEASFVDVVAVCLRAVDEVEDRQEVRCFPGVDRLEMGGAREFFPIGVC